MMDYLEVTSLAQLSPMINDNPKEKPVSPSWVQVYRELVEWATLFSIIKNKDFGTDTLIVFDGLLRSKVFSQDLFLKTPQRNRRCYSTSMGEKQEKNICSRCSKAQ